jgi:hypothetical protein
MAMRDISQLLSIASETEAIEEAVPAAPEDAA